MTETDEKHENPEEKKPVKQGLHGWKAALAMFGCGSLAAFGVFGVIAAIFGSFLSMLSTGPGGEGSEEGAAHSYQPNQPLEEFDEDKLDLCDLTLPAINRAPIVMDSDHREPEDASVDGGAPEQDSFVRSDNCSGIWTPSASALSPWDIDFSYRAFVFTPDGEKEVAAQEEMDDWVSRMEGEGGSDWEFGEVNFLEESRYAYTADEGQSAEYRIVSRERSVVLEMTLVSDLDNSKSDFTDELQKVESGLELDIGTLIPE